MKVFSAKQMRELDAFTIASERISSVDLMECAAREVALALMMRWASSTPFVVFAGAGNNGGDALAVSRLLLERGYSVKTYLVNPKGELRPDCQINKERLKEVPNAHLIEIAECFDLPTLTSDMVIVDGLFGTGLNKPLSGIYATLVLVINAAPAQVVAIDMPSGLMCESNQENTEATIVRANFTLTFQYPKLAQLMDDNYKYVGTLEILDIGLSATFAEELQTPYQLLNDADVARLLAKRSPIGHKGTFGHALLIAGKYGMAGAAILAAKSCLRSGVGKVSIHTPTRNNDILQISVPEAILSHDADAHSFTTPLSNLSATYQALGIGPGLGVSTATSLAMLEQVQQTDVPLVVDADGLNILAAHRGALHLLPKRTILTPHLGEFLRLGHRSVNHFTALSEAREMAATLGIYIVLKGRYTAICTPEGKTYFNTTGNSGLATAGSGDVLTGILTSLLAQGYAPHDACLLGVWLHGKAGDCAAKQLTEESLTASDVIQYLPEAFKALKKQNSSVRIY